MIQHIVHNCITLLWFSSKKYSKIQSKSQMSCSDAKESACNTGDGVNPWVGKIPWNREWQSTPVFLPGESHGQRRLAGYSPWGHWTQLSNTSTSSLRCRSDFMSFYRAQLCNALHSRPQLFWHSGHHFFFFKRKKLEYIRIYFLCP